MLYTIVTYIASFAIVLTSATFGIFFVGMSAWGDAVGSDSSGGWVHTSTAFLTKIYPFVTLVLIVMFLLGSIFLRKHIAMHTWRYVLVSIGLGILLLYPLWPVLLDMLLTKLGVAQSPA